MNRLDRSFYLNSDVVQTARDLLGLVLCTDISGIVTSGVITETEAYHESEKACHAYNGRKTARTSTLFEEGGIAYVYLCYGIHHLFNIVTGRKGVGQAVLIRALMPIAPREIILERRNRTEWSDSIASGPGTLSQAMGITTELNREDLVHGRIWLEDRGIIVNENDIAATPRIGVDYAGEDAKLPWRFTVEINKIRTIY